MRIAIGSDHGGYQLKEHLVAKLSAEGFEIIDLGTSSDESVDYPDFAEQVCRRVLDSEAEIGILVCGTGIGMSMAANRHRGIRAALCHNEYSARMSREHNNANVLCLGDRVIGPGLAESIVDVWITTQFSGGRHQTRISKFSI